jgi:flagellar motor switch protein FliG
MIDHIVDLVEKPARPNWAQMRLVDRDTMLAVVTEFVETLEQVGLSFPEGLEGALQALTGKLSPAAAGRLRQMARASGHADPWDRIAQTETEALIELLAPESTEVTAVVISKLPVARAAELLGKMPGERARRVAYAISQTEGIAPDAVARIGVALAAELDRRPQPAFVAPPAARVGAILNSSPADLRDRLLAGLDEENADFATGVRKSIFTFGHIAARLKPTDVPKVLREVEQTSLITALAAALPQTDSPVGQSAEYLLANMSQRMAATLRDEIEGRGRVKSKDAETAMSEVVAAIRTLCDAGEIALVEADEDE